MRPLDPRLLRYARSTRTFLVAAVLIGMVIAALVITQAIILGHTIASAFQDHASLRSLRGAIIALLLVTVGRAVAGWASDVVGDRAAAGAKSELRISLLAHALRLGPSWLTGERSGALTTLSTRGIDGLDDYYSRYLPQVVLTCIVPPAVVVTIFILDPLSAVIVAVTLPLIPLFLALIGKFTQSRVDRQWRTLAVLSGHFLDVVAGLPTLKSFGRAKAQDRSLAAVGEEYRTTTMGVLRVSFLSSLALELLALLSVALVAVSIGLRLVDGHLGLRTGLVVLILAPEAYLPVRLVGQYFHAAAEGIGAAQQVFDVLETQPPERGRTTAVPDLRRNAIVIDGVGVTYPDRDHPALSDATLTLRPATVTAIVGPSGAGKSTLMSVLLGFVSASTGHIRIESLDGVKSCDVNDLDPDAWRRCIAYVPQTAYLPTGTLADAVRLGQPSVTDEEIVAALGKAGLDLEGSSGVHALPAGLQTRVGDGGVGISAGQRRRVALARAFCRDAPLVLLDEPTAALDGSTEDAVVDAIRLLRAAGRTVVVVAHRPALVAIADQIVVFDAPALAAADIA